MADERNALFESRCYVRQSSSDRRNDVGALAARYTWIPWAFLVLNFLVQTLEHVETEHAARCPRSNPLEYQRSSKMCFLLPLNIIIWQTNGRFGYAPQKSTWELEFENKRSILTIIIVKSRHESVHRLLYLAELSSIKFNQEIVFSKHLVHRSSDARSTPGPGQGYRGSWGARLLRLLWSTIHHNVLYSLTRRFDIACGSEHNRATIQSLIVVSSVAAHRLMLRLFDQKDQDSAQWDMIWRIESLLSFTFQMGISSSSIFRHKIAFES